MLRRSERRNEFGSQSRCYRLSSSRRVVVFQPLLIVTTKETDPIPSLRSKLVQGADRNVRRKEGINPREAQVSFRPFLPSLGGARERKVGHSGPRIVAKVELMI